MTLWTGDAGSEKTVVTSEIVRMKKPYRRPQLMRLGTLADMTRKVGYNGQGDGGRFPQRFRTGTF